MAPVLASTSSLGVRPWLAGAVAPAAAAFRAPVADTAGWPPGSERAQRGEGAGGGEVGNDARAGRVDLRLGDSFLGDAARRPGGEHVVALRAGALVVDAADGDDVGVVAGR